MNLTDILSNWKVWVIIIVIIVVIVIYIKVSTSSLITICGIDIMALFGWKFWMIVIVLTFFGMWLFVGGKRGLKFVGLNPLKVPDSSVVNNQLETIPEEDLGETLAAQAFKDLLDRDVEINTTPPFLYDKDTNEYLLITAYDPITKVGVMYHPYYHYNYPSKYFTNEEDFKEVIYDNELRLSLCDEAGIYLITISYKVDLGDANSHVPKKRRYARIKKFISDELDKIRVEHK